MQIDLDYHNRIADLCLNHFKTLPKSGKPKQSEWTILSCIVLEFEDDLNVVALGTGSKCIGKNKMSPSGDILNDSHAEVICRRSFLRYLYEKGLGFIFFTTHVPCGDAAIFPKQNLEDFGNIIGGTSKSAGTEDEYEVPSKKVKVEEDGDIFRTGAKCLAEDIEQDLKLGGGGYHVLGAVRTKPGRGDPTLSVSCSDKFAKWCHLGLQGALLSLLLEKPIYLKSFTISGSTPFCKEALERAFYERLGNVSLDSPYAQNKMVIGQSTRMFEFAKDSAKQPCPSSISWCEVDGKRAEVAVDGRKQGVTKKNLNTPSGRLSICKLSFFKSFGDICESCSVNLTENMTYKEVKMLACDYQKKLEYS
ncbi:hypothetical protein NQ317_001198 [Molorchus minor]|uniref:tRNA-specific adenosine deaminase 1 n=1 Tax=Molorchus minor TaxID=1323400 RepID=A0ABQ9JG21_9CUCU|nr:hypothetical protein NQ317_001198 [Molorchus minor]